MCRCPRILSTELTSNTMDDCDICFEPFNLKNRRPKVLPCGHTCCLDCLNEAFSRGLQVCPTDRKQYECLPTMLPDNFHLIQSSNSSKKATFWCADCQNVADDDCIESHLICSLKKVRSDEVEKNLNIIQRERKDIRSVLERLASVRDAIKDCFEDCIERRSVEDESLSTIIRNVKQGLQSDAKSWKKIKRSLDDAVAARVNQCDHYLDEHRLLTLSAGTLKVDLRGFPLSWKGSLEVKDGPDWLSALLFLFSDSGSLQREVSLPQLHPAATATITQPQHPSQSQSQASSSQSQVQPVPAVRVKEEPKDADQEPSCSPQQQGVRVRPLAEMQGPAIYQEDTEHLDPKRLRERIAVAQDTSVPVPPSVGRASPLKRNATPNSVQAMSKKPCKQSPSDQRRSVLMERARRVEEKINITLQRKETHDQDLGLDQDTSFKFNPDNILDVQDLNNTGPNENMLSKQLICSTANHKIKQLLDLNCGADHTWSLSLLRLLKPHVEDVHVYQPSAEHMAVLAEMPRLRRLTVRAYPKNLSDLEEDAFSRPGHRATLQEVHLELPAHRALSWVRAHAGTLREVTMLVGMGATVDSAVALWPWQFTRLDERLSNFGLRSLKCLFLLRQPGSSTQRGRTARCENVCGRQVTVLRRALPGVQVMCLQCAS